MNIRMSGRLAGLAMLFALAACGGGQDAQANAAPAEAPATAAPADAPAAGNVIVVKMITDAQGNNVFEPAQITAKKGDVLRFTLESGVHNVRFTEGAAGATLPPAGQYLSTPGQFEDVVVDFPAGDYKFQCDPHAALGMVGTLKVQG